MVSKKKEELKRILVKIAELIEFKHNKIELDQKSITLLEINQNNYSSNYGPIIIDLNQRIFTDFSIKIDAQLAQKLGIYINDYIEIFKRDHSLFFIPILSQDLIKYFYNIYGSKRARVILLSSHAEFEPFTREIATRTHLRLQELAVPSLRIETQKHYINWNKKIDTTVSRYEVDITRKEDKPQIIAKKLVNKNFSYRPLAKIYFQLISKSISSKERCIVVDIHGFATISPHGIKHPMVLIGDAFSKNPLIKNFTKTIEKSSRKVIPNLWIVYRPIWGSVEYSLQIVKKSNNLPIIIEIRRDLRENSKKRNYLIELISNALKLLVENLPPDDRTDNDMVSYRTFQEKDLDHIHSIYLKGYSALYGEKIQEHAEHFLKLFRDSLLEETEGEMFVAVQNNLPIGFAVIYKEPTNEWKFGPIIVLPAAQNQGIGSHLLQLCINFAYSKQAKQFYLKVHEINQIAINLYKKFGFFITDILPSDLKEINFLKMVYTL